MNLLIVSGILLNLLVAPGGLGVELKAMLDFDNNKYINAVSDDFTKITVDVTAYSPTKRETDSTPFTTASNKRVKEGYIAISRDLEAHLSFGDKVFIEGLGIFEVQDRMNRRWKHRIDLFFFDTKKAINFGKMKKEMWILESSKYEKQLAKE